MKTKLLFTILYCMLCGPLASSGICCVSAQVCLKKKDGQGLCVGNPISEKSIIEIFGQPQRTWIEEGEEIDGLMKTYVYENLRIAVVNGALFDFSFSNCARNADCVVVVNGKYHLKLGASYAAFINSIPVTDVMVRKYEESVMQLFFKIADDNTFSDSSLHVTLDEQGAVTRISWVSPV